MRSRRGLPREHRPIYFGFGSTPVQSPADTIAMIADGLRGAGRTGADLFRRERLRAASHIPTT